MAKPKNDGAKPKQKHGRNWARIKTRWFQCELSLAKFCRSEDIPLATGKRHLSLAEKNSVLEAASTASSEFLKRVSTKLGEENGRLQVAALKKVMQTAEEILVDSTVDFKGMSGRSGSWNSTGEAARVALAAGAVLKEVARELTGIPAEDDDFIWPVTKDFWPFPAQRDFIFDLPSTLRQQGENVDILALLGGIGSGKTRCGAEKFGKLCELNRGLPMVCYAPTYRMLDDATKRTFIDVLVKKGVGFTVRAQENRIILWGDTPVDFRSLDDPEHLRGPEYAAGWIDEGLQMPTRYPFDVVMGRIRHPEARELCLLFTGSKAGFGWGYDIFVEERAKNRVKVYEIRTDQNPIQVKSGYVDRLRGIYDPKLAQQELDAEWVNIGKGKAYWNFSRTRTVIAQDKYKVEPQLPLVLNVDFNVSPMCWNVGQERVGFTDQTVLYVFDELHLDTAGTEVAAKEFMLRHGRHVSGVEVYGDATGFARSTKATRTDYEIIVQILTKGFVHDGKKIPGMRLEPVINVGRANPGESDRVFAHNARLLDATNRRKLFVTDNCIWTIKDYEKVAFKAGTRQIDKTSDPGVTHHTDAIGYYCMKKFPLRGPRITMGRG